MRELEYADVRKIVNFISKNNIYNQELFLFSSDVDVKSTSEVSMRNSFFTYSMIGYCEVDEKTLEIKKLALFKSDIMQQNRGVLKLELSSYDSKFLKKVFEEISNKELEENIRCIQINLQRRQINGGVCDLLNKLGFICKAVFKAKDENRKMDLLLFQKNIEA